MLLATAGSDFKARSKDVITPGNAGPQPRANQSSSGLLFWSTHLTSPREFNHLKAVNHEAGQTPVDVIDAKSTSQKVSYESGASAVPTGKAHPLSAKAIASSRLFTPAPARALRASTLIVMEFIADTSMTIIRSLMLDAI